MRKRTSAVVLALAALAALALAGHRHRGVHDADADGLVPARQRHAHRRVASDGRRRDRAGGDLRPAGTHADVDAAPGTTLGTVKAQVSALALGGALLPLAGDIIVAPPGAVPAATADRVHRQRPTPRLHAGCSCSRRPARRSTCPLYVVPTSGRRQALGPAQARLLPAAAGHPRAHGRRDVRREVPQRRPVGQRRLQHRSPRARGSRFWTPWTPAERPGQRRRHGRLAGRDRARQPSTLRARKARGARRRHRPRHRRRAPASPARVQICGAVDADGARRLAASSAKANGTFTYAVTRTSRATRFQAARRSSRRGRRRRGAARSCRHAARAVRERRRSAGFGATSRSVSVRSASRTVGWRAPRRAPAFPIVAAMAATVRLGTCSWADDGLLKAWYPRGVSTAGGAPALLRRAVRHRRGRLAVLRAARPGGDRALGRAHARRRSSSTRRRRRR